MIARKVRKAPGFTVCRECRQVADNDTLFELVKPGKTKGRVVCEACAKRHRLAYLLGRS